MTATVREIAIWCDQTPERRKAVMLQVEKLELASGQKAATVIVQAQRMVYDRRERSPRPSELVMPGTYVTWLLLASRNELRRVARGETTMAEITIERLGAFSSFSAKRQFTQSGYVIREDYALEIIADLAQLLADAPDPLAMPPRQEA